MLKSLLQALPGICFTISDFAELNTLIVSKNIQDFSLIAYTIFMFVNLNGFIYTNKLYDIKSISAWLFPAIIEMTMILISLRRNNPAMFYPSLAGSILFYITYFYIVYTVKLPIKLFGFLPSILAPLGELVQFYKIIHNKGCHGVSQISWILQCLGNIGLFFLIDKNTFENYLITVIPALLDGLIVLSCLQL